MKQARAFLLTHKTQIGIALIVLAGLSAFYSYRLASLVPGLSYQESMASTQIVGWHGLSNDPLYLPLKFIRSIVFTVAIDHGRLLTRLPNVLFGVLSVLSLIALVKLWHGWRTALLIGLLYASSAWTLHTTRLASFDVLYLWATPTILLLHSLTGKFPNKKVLMFSTIAIWGLLLYIPGMVWLIAPIIYSRRPQYKSLLTNESTVSQRVIFGLLSSIWLPLLLYRLATSGDFLKTWLGLPTHFANMHSVLKEFLAVPLHLFIRGPEYSDLWLGKMPILDIFTLTITVLGIYFYLRHWKNSRARLLLFYLIGGGVLIGLHGPVSLSLLVPLLYIFAGMGITYLLHEWLKVFPRNPLARGIGIAVLSIAVFLSCILNTRAYFVAWPHNLAAKATFQYQRLN
ncbi:MAG: hypothetical protein QFB86_00530 [Patescibacteria group bacterium]|nr:hypothetical protein [Patescibacteria group bacterium]